MNSDIKVNQSGMIRNTSCWIGDLDFHFEVLLEVPLLHKKDRIFKGNFMSWKNIQIDFHFVHFHMSPGVSNNSERTRVTVVGMRNYELQDKKITNGLLLEVLGSGQVSKNWLPKFKSKLMGFSQAPDRLKNIENACLLFGWLWRRRNDFRTGSRLEACPTFLSYLKNGKNEESVLKSKDRHFLSSLHGSIIVNRL